jgi:prevent-host-death family protein
MTPLRFVTVTELQQRATAIVTEVERSGKLQVIITKNGKPVAILQRVTEEEFPNLDRPKNK